jgi:hypothetical protein
MLARPLLGEEARGHEPLPPPLTPLGGVAGEHTYFMHLVI